MERLNGFPDDWTRFSGAEEVSDVKRAFFMGNALVVGLIELVGKELAKRMS
jgi:DNA (cytosine-5)-methyltransferase 1